jgi:hypothetical protein
VTRILNPSEVSGEIAFFGEQTGNFRECHTFQELSAVAQEAGAVGAIIPYYDEPGRIPPWADPQILPFDFQIDTYIVLAASGDMITPYIDGDHTPEVVNEEVTLRLPPTTNGWGESYFPHPDTYGALPQAVIGVKKPGNTKFQSYVAPRAKLAQKELAAAAQQRRSSGAAAAQQRRSSGAAAAQQRRSSGAAAAH